MSAFAQCLSHSPLIGHFDPQQDVLDEVGGAISAAKDAIARFSPELVFLFSPDHFNGFFYDLMPAFCIGTAAAAIGDYGTAAGPLDVPRGLAEACATSVLAAGVDVAVSYRMQVDHGFAQPLEQLFDGLAQCPVIPIFVNAVAPPLPSFQRARLLGKAIGAFARTLDKRVLFLASGGLSHQPPVPQLATADAQVAERLLGGGRNLPADERAARQRRVIDAAQRFSREPSELHPLNPEWDAWFLDTLAQGRLAELDGLSNEELSLIAGRSTHEVKAWVAAFAALAEFGPYQASGRYYRPIPEWIAGFGALQARPLASPGV